MSALFISVCTATKVRYYKHWEIDMRLYTFLLQKAKKRQKRRTQKQVNDTIKTDLKIKIIRKKLP